MILEHSRTQLSKSTSFITNCYQQNGCYSSVPNGPGTLYGTVYALLALHYLGYNRHLAEQTSNFISNCQIESGEYIGPELYNFEPSRSTKHDREHLVHHLTCAVIPVCLQFKIPIRYKLQFARRFCNKEYLIHWLDARDLTQAWLEGNNILFVGQLLVYLRDVERYKEANAALQCWFEWLDTHIDPATSLWGTDGYCSAMEAVYGGYHQLLVYYHENHRVPNPQGLVDTVLSLQHYDGSFHPGGNGGACEDVDCVDILVNMYKQYDYRRRDIRIALRRCMHHILYLQNPDGGFPYNRDQWQSHMNVPGTPAPPNVSTTFATWFRIHTLALIAQVLPMEPSFRGIDLKFNNSLSMGWHRVWDLKQAERISAEGSEIMERVAEVPFKLQYYLNSGQRSFYRLYRSSKSRTGALLRYIIKLRV